MAGGTKHHEAQCLPAPAAPSPEPEPHTAAQIRTESPDWGIEVMIHLFIDDRWYVCRRDDAVSYQGGSSVPNEVKRNEGISIRGCIVGIVITVVLALAGYLSYVYFGAIYDSEPWLRVLALLLFAPAVISLVYFFLWAFRPGSGKLTIALAIAFLITCAGFIVGASSQVFMVLNFDGRWLIVIAIGTLIGVGSVAYLVKRRNSQHPADETDDYPPFKWED
jgi:hypothetical protein